jgi:hypothetical protein
MDGEESGAWWMTAMTSGLQANVGLLATVLPRVSPEYAVIAAAAGGLIAASGSDVVVEIEHQRRDLVVKKNGGVFWFEFKAFWSNGVKECTQGVLADLEKIRGQRDAFAVAFAYALSSCPSGLTRRTPRGLKETVEVAEAGIGKATVVGDPIVIAWHDTVGSARLLAWAAPM